MIVYTVGTFDLLHVGHLALLEHCASLGDTVAVGIASDEVVKLYKPNVPVIPLEQRIEMLQALRCVDIVIPYHELDYLTICQQVKADIFVMGDDWEGKFDFLKKYCQVIYLPRTVGISTTKLKQIL